MYVLYICMMYVSQGIICTYIQWRASHGFKTPLRDTQFLFRGVLPRGVITGEQE